MSIAKNIYFLGIGGIGMSALARYFNLLGKSVSGYDLTKTDLTKKLEQENIAITYKDKTETIPQIIKANKDVTVVYTPAIPDTNEQFIYFKNRGFHIFKRAEMLGLISKNSKNIAIAGTHGKTTISSIVTHILQTNNTLLGAFLGGITKNYDTNFVSSQKNISEGYTVIEADEYDRSFLNFYPQISLVSTLDADHLDIYGNKKNLTEAFEKFLSQTNSGGAVVLNKKINLNLPNNIKKYSYSLKENSDFFAKNIRNENGFYTIDLQTPAYLLENVKIGIPGIINVENCIGAAAVAYLSGAEPENIKKGLATFAGVKRRFDVQIRKPHLIYIDDYAHHPEEISAFVGSVRKMFDKKKIIGIFQPHLYSRTQDFVSEFAESLSLLDELILTDIYPARELPIEGVTSKIIFDKVSIENKILCKKDEVLEVLKNKKVEVILTIGAGNIDTLVPKIKKLLD